MMTTFQKFKSASQRCHQKTEQGREQAAHLLFSALNEVTEELNGEGRFVGC